MKVIIYHANCVDGFCAAYIARSHFLNQSVAESEMRFIPAKYGDTVPVLAISDEVFILDFSYPRAVLEDLRGTVKSLIVLDHHKTAEEALRGLDYCTFDMGKSGAMLAFEYFGMARVQYSFVRYVQDRDLWEWKLDSSREVSAAIASYEMTFAVWDDLRKMDFYDCIKQGQAILRYQNQLVERAVKSAGLAEIGGHVVPCVNATVLQSEIGEALSKGVPFAATWFEDAHGDRIYSLRSSPDGIDVSEVAKKYGGGGHAHAAGFNVKK